jgi:UDP-N-acetylmuramoyl-L-alanyl-D-glutamate--2,6-diaminopimelate ligase
MEQGVEVKDQSKVLRISQRDQAIKTACRLGKANDFILIAGKGHEKYQDINGVKHPFDDKEILEKEMGVN